MLKTKLNLPTSPFVLLDGAAVWAGTGAGFVSSAGTDVMLLVSASIDTSFPPLRFMVPVSPSESSPQYPVEDAQLALDCAWSRPSLPWLCLPYFVPWSGNISWSMWPPEAHSPAPSPELSKWACPKGRVSQLLWCCMVWMLSWEPLEQEVQLPRPLSAASSEALSPWSCDSSSVLGEESTVAPAYRPLVSDSGAYELDTHWWGGQKIQCWNWKSWTRCTKKQPKKNKTRRGLD